MSSDPLGIRPMDRNPTPRRVPKLTYRNALPQTDTAQASGQSVPLDRTQYSQEQRATLPIAAQHVMNKHAHGDLQIPRRPKDISACDATPFAYVTSTPPHRSSAGDKASGQIESSNAHGEAKRKKSGSFLGFLSLKEPSTLALEEFARQQQKQAATKNGRQTAVGMPGISSQKLPPTVPKVNSKWNGLPSPAKDTKGSKRNSTLTVGSQNSRSSSSKISSRASMSSNESMVSVNHPTHSTMFEAPAQGNARNPRPFSSHAPPLPHLPTLSSPPLGESKLPSYPEDLPDSSTTPFTSREGKKRADSVAESRAPLSLPLQPLSDSRTDADCQASSDSGSQIHLPVKVNCVNCLHSPSVVRPACETDRLPQEEPSDCKEEQHGTESSRGQESGKRETNTKGKSPEPLATAKDDEKKRRRGFLSRIHK